MMAMIQALVFAGALALIGIVLAGTVLPALPRMAKLLRGELDPAFAPSGGPALRPAAGRARRTAAPAAGWREAA
jgi:hypothetical protein